METSRTQTHSSNDSKSLNVELAHDRSRQPVVETNTENVTDGYQTRSCHESISFNVEDETLRDRSVQPVVNHDDSSHEQTMLNEENMHFRIPGLPHSVVKHAQSTSVRELIQKIENHPSRHALQQDLRQNQAYNPTRSVWSQTNDSGRRQRRSGWIVRDGHQESVQSMLVILEWRHRLLHIRAFFIETVANRGFIVFTMNLVSIARVRNKKGRLHGPRFWKLPGNNIFWPITWKRDASRGTTNGIHDRFLRDHVSLDEWFNAIEMKKFVVHGTFLPDEDHTYHMSEQE